MKYLFDTDWVADYLAGRPAAQTLSELYQGILGSYNPSLGKHVFRTFLRSTTVLGVTRGVAETNAAIRLHFDRQKTQYKHRALDLVIAATAIHHNLVLVTRNHKDFSDVPGLTLHPFDTSKLVY